MPDPGYELRVRQIFEMFKREKRYLQPSQWSGHGLGGMVRV